MKNRVTQLFFPITIALLVFLLLYLYLRDTMFDASELGKEQSIPTVLIVLLGVVPLGYVFIVRKIPAFSFARPYIFFVLLVYLLSLFHPLGSGLYVITILFPLIFFLFSYTIDSQIHSKVFLIMIVALLMSLALFFYFNYDSYLLVEIESRTMGAYTLLYFLPFVLCVKNRLLRIICIFLILTSLFMSLKRGGIIAFSIALLAYLSIKYLFESKKKIGGVIIVVLIIFILFYAFQYFDNQFDNMLTTRFEGLEDDEGSHRMDLYTEVWRMIEQSSIIGLMFGHGWDSVVKYNTMQYSAHNEFLEVMYDTGIFAFLSLVVFIISIIYYNVCLVKAKSKMGAPLAASLTLFIINSTISHTLLYAKYIILFSLFWGFVLAEHKKEGEKIFE